MINKLGIAFIIGTGRCGTSLLGQILNTHSEICVPPELQVIFEYDGNGNRLFEEFCLNGPAGLDGDALSSIIQRCCPHKLDLFFDYEGYCHREGIPRSSLSGFLFGFYRAIATVYGKSWLIEQTPWYGQRLDILVKLFPDAKFIHMVRDGRDVALSFSRTPWWYRSVHWNLWRWQRELKKIYLDASLYLSPSSYLETKYEDLVTNTEYELRRICKFLGLDFETNMMESHRFIDYGQFCRFDFNAVSSKAYVAWEGKKDVAVFSDSIGAWQREAELFSGGFSAAVSDWLSRYGYDLGIEGGVSQEKHQNLYGYNLTTYIQSLEESRMAQSQTIADQAIRLQSLEESRMAQSQTIADQAIRLQSLEESRVAQSQTIADQAIHIGKVEAELLEYRSSWYERVKAAAKNWRHR